MEQQQQQQEHGGQQPEVSYSWYFKLALLECNVFQDITKLNPEKVEGGQGAGEDLQVKKVEVSLSKQSNYLNCL